MRRGRFRRWRRAGRRPIPSLPRWPASGRTSSSNGRSAMRFATPHLRSPRTSATPWPKRRTRPGLPPSTRGLARSTPSSRRSSRTSPRWQAPRRCRWPRRKRLLGDGEALVLFLDTPDKKPTPEETFIWVATKTQARWVRSELGKAALVREVEALRCGLDQAAWAGTACAKLTGETYTEADASAGKPLPFDPARAHKLYKALFGQAAGPHPRQAALARAIGRAHAAAVPGAGDGGAQRRRAACLAHPRSRADRAAGGVLAQGAAAAYAHQKGGKAHGRLRQSAARRSGRAL